MSAAGLVADDSEGDMSSPCEFVDGLGFGHSLTRTLPTGPEAHRFAPGVLLNPSGMALLMP